MKLCEALVIGGSAGSLDALMKVMPGLDAYLPFPIILVLHRKSGQDHLLTDLLQTKTRLRVKELDEKEKILPRTLYIAPPDYHLLIENDRSFSLDASEKVNFSRPSIDVTFESAAEVYGEKLACLLLSGANSDGTAGLQKAAARGGRVLIQEPSSAIVPFMPQHALENVPAEAVLTPEKMAPYINQLVKSPSS